MRAIPIERRYSHRSFVSTSDFILLYPLTFTDCNGQTLVQIIDLLKKRRLLQPTPGSKVKGFSLKGLPRFMFPSSGDIQARLQAEILSPMIKIQHHVS